MEWLLLILLPIAVGLGVWGSHIAEQRGRPAELGWVLGLFLGPIGLAIVMLAPHGRAAEERRERIVTRLLEDKKAPPSGG